MAPVGFVLNERGRVHDVIKVAPVSATQMKLSVFCVSMGNCRVSLKSNNNNWTQLAPPLIVVKIE